MKRIFAHKSILPLVVLSVVATACSDGSALNALSLEQKKLAQSESSTTKSADSEGNSSSAVGTRTQEKNLKVSLRTIDIEGLQTVGLEAVQEARRAGHSTDAIVAQALSSSFAMSEEALSFLGISKFVLKQYGTSAVEGVNAMGLASVERARAAGVKDSEIITYAKLQGIFFGENALNSLGLSKYVLSRYGSGIVEGVKAMGLPAVDKARAAGLKDSEIITYAKLQGIFFGDRALVSLGLNKYVLSNYGTAVVEGVLAMGLAAVDRARAAGLSDAEIKIYAKLQGIAFGERALNSLGV
ncbi:MAG: hypothetical protein FJY29_10820 [Betaproteobacteria bacterium]|nr:hypothetical protein [Betaproteobacteria bacterium]